MIQKNISITNFNTKIYIPIYGDDIILRLEDRKDFEKYLLKNYKTEESISENTQGFFIDMACSKGGFDKIVWMPSFDWTINDQKILCHELLHVTLSMLKTRGVDITEGVGESTCYLFSYIFGEFWYILKKEFEKREKNAKKKSI